MKSIRAAGCSLLLFVTCGTVLWGADLSTYRGFQLGMGLSAAVKHSGMDLSEVTVIHERPARIQELVWHPDRFFRASADSDPVEEVVFSFYNGQLFRMVVNYNADKVTGLTSADIVDAISAQYGSATKTGVAPLTIKLPLSDSTAQVVARWENEQYSLNLIQTPYSAGLKLLIFSKSLNALAETAVTEGTRLDEQEAPQRQKIQEQNEQRQLDKTRLVNKERFRP